MPTMKDLGSFSNDTPAFSCTNVAAVNVYLQGSTWRSGANALKRCVFVLSGVPKIRRVLALVHK